MKTRLHSMSYEENNSPQYNNVFLLQHSAFKKNINMGRVRDNLI